MRRAVAAVVTAVIAYVAWIPAAADNAHPTVALIVSVVFWLAVTALVAMAVVALVRVRKRQGR